VSICEYGACCVQKPFRAGEVRVMDEREVGRRIAHWRKRRGLTQALFADRIGRSKSWVEKVEAGARRASLRHLEQIAAVLRVDLNVLIRDDRHSGEPECLDRVENVGVHRVSALVRLGDGGLAVEAAGALAPGHLAVLPRERRATHMVTLGLACSQAGYRDRALWALLEAEQVAAEEVHCREQARDLIRDLLRRERTRPPLELSRLAERAGVNP
jgi:transcriptional regulator with XRE-family HTH domain